MHVILKKEIDEAQQYYDTRLKATNAVAALLDELQLTPLLDMAFDVYFQEDGFWSSNGTIPADRYWLTILMQATYKPLARPIILAALDNTGSYEKTYYVENMALGPNKANTLKEIWIANFDKLHHPDHFHTTAYHQVKLIFTSPADEGRKLSPACSIKRVETCRTESTSRLAVVCEKPENAD